MRQESNGNLVTVLVVIEDEFTRLPELHDQIQASLEGRETELVYLVRASAESAARAAAELCKAAPARVRVLRFGDSIGGAAMLNAGLEAARGELVLTLPGEFDAKLSDLAPLFEALRDGADVVIASRSTWKDATARVQSRVFSWLLSRAVGLDLGDVTSRTRLMRTEVVRDLPMYGEFHRYLPVLAHRMGLRVRELQVERHPDAPTATAFGPSAYLWRALDLLSLFFLARFTRHPLRLFGGFGGALGLVGFVVLAVATFERLFLGVPLADRPVLPLGTFLLGLGVQMLTIGLLGELILFVHGRNVREYRVAQTLESSPPPLPETAAEGAASSREGDS